MFYNMKSQSGFKKMITIVVSIYAVYYKGLGAALSLTVIDKSGSYIFHTRAKTYTFI